MRLRMMRLHNFRNYENMKLTFNDGIHILFGKNAQGKTNFLEAIYYLSTTRSHRGSKDEHIVLKEQDAFFIQAEIEKKQQKQQLKIAVNEKGKNLYRYRDVVAKVSDFIGECNAIMFCPDDIMLFQASPRVRRRFIDLELSKISKTYVSTLYLANKLLKERNMYLKRERIDETYLEVLTQQLVDASVIIIKQRHHFLQALLQHSSTFYKQLSQDETLLDVAYESCIPYADEDVMKQQLLNKYHDTLQRDRTLKVTSIGIHKEDFIFKINNQDVCSYASQGQKRTILLSLKVGLIYMIHALTKEYPILLLDDVFSELDYDRRRELLCSLPDEVQIFISTTDIDEFRNLSLKKSLWFWKVSNGSIDQI